LKARIESGRSRIAMLEPQLQPVVKELTGLNERIETLAAELKSLDEQHKTGLQIDIDNYNAKVKAHNALLSRHRALIVANSHAVRRITEILERMGIEVVDFAGRTYDPGMVPEVVEVREDQGLPNGHAVIDETIAPTVSWCGQVVKPGQIIVKRSPVQPQEYTEVVE